MAGNLYVVAAPSGAGKTTLVRLLLEGQPDIRLSISYTTRDPRPGEENGREYHFVDTSEFRAMIDRHDFLEWAEVHGNFYGTSQKWIADQLAAGIDVLLEIDWQGAQQVRSLFPAAIGIFILPPSMEELTSRLTGRGTDSSSVIARRLAAAQAEMRHWPRHRPRCAMSANSTMLLLTISWLRLWTICVPWCALPALASLRSVPVTPPFLHA